MPWFHEFLTSISRSCGRSRPGLGIRIPAAALSAALAFGTVAPGVAFAGEADSEQEGSAPPGALPGLEEAPELEPGGEETVLEELPGAPVGDEEGPPLETEPPQEPEPVPAPSSTAEAVQPPVEEAPSAPAPGPEYGPAYEPAPASPPSAPVENQPLAAPESPPSPQPTQHAPEAVQSVPEAPAPSSPPEAPEPEAVPPAAVPVQRNGAAGSLVGHSVHTVRAGECLWSIAEALLPAGAGNAEIEAEVQRIWKLNAARIGTGDPNLLYAGTQLRLR